MEYYAIVFEHNGKQHIMRDGLGRLFVYDCEEEAVNRLNDAVSSGIMLPDVKIVKVTIGELNG